MIKTIQYRGASIRFSDSGEGEALVFLHGYLLSFEVWQDFVAPLTEQYRVICIDLPGHGKSGLIESVSTMELMADSVLEVLNASVISKAVFFGHSMGGYTALALLEKRPDIFKGISLFHSHTLPDNEEVKTKRDREVKLIDQGHKNLLVSQSIPNMFATELIDANTKHVEACKQLAKDMDNDGVKAAILGLRSRQDRSELLSGAKCPCLNIIGKKDNFISYEEVALKTVLPPESERLIAENSGHMGFFEEPEFIRLGILQFLKRIL